MAVISGAAGHSSKKERKIAQILYICIGVAIIFFALLYLLPRNSGILQSRAPSVKGVLSTTGTYVAPSTGSAASQNSNAFQTYPSAPDEEPVDKVDEASGSSIPEN